MNHKFADIFFKHLFFIVALFSVLALGAILLFVFVQGTLPFFTSTAQGIRLVPQRIDELMVNGELYRDHSSFINLPRDTGTISISFPAPSGEPDSGERLEITVNTSEKNPEKALSFSQNGNIEITYPEAYVHTVSWPAAMKALEKRIHIILPEPPYNFFKFVSGLEWRPSRNKIFGVFPMIAGTLMASFGAILLGVPVALLCAVFMSEFLPAKIASLSRGGIELLAGIPSVVYGFFGLMVIVPAVKKFFHISSGNTLLSAVIVLSLMILPTIITIAETSLRAVPLSVREASLSLGASKMQTSWRVVLPHANSGVVAGIILGISRAVGETMAVILVAGNSPQLVYSPLQSVRTLTSTIAMEMGYASGRHSEMLFSIGVVLFSIILVLNSLILWFRRRIEEGT
ncbi:MAG: phosphate ABC transporter permease subunit PstC [Treponema sp.]|jgi:phosphate transport system permease protein|nr:phosphate ABC transporter permease subunit PstC [Treponema sp.]